MNPTKVLFFLLFALQLPLSANELERRSFTGEVVSITYDDLSSTFGLDKNEARYAVRVKLRNLNGIVLGFGKPGQPLDKTARAKLDVLLEAMNRRYTVRLRLDSVVKADIVPSHASIIAITLRP